MKYKKRDIRKLARLYAGVTLGLHDFDCLGETDLTPDDMAVFQEEYHKQGDKLVVETRLLREGDKYPTTLGECLNLWKKSLKNNPARIGGKEGKDG